MQDSVIAIENEFEIETEKGSSTMSISNTSLVVH